MYSAVAIPADSAVQPVRSDFENAQLPNKFEVVQNRPKVLLRLAQCRPRSSQGRFIFDSASIFCVSLDCIDENLTLFIVFRRFPSDNQIFSIATEGKCWLQIARYMFKFTAFMA